MVVDETKRKPRIVEFEMAEKVGVKDKMTEALNEVIQGYKGKLPSEFVAEELFYIFEKGMAAAGVKPKFKVKRLTTLARAFLHGYIVGKKIVGD